jgi:drug/metabolite transporter (DMT)-like permease
MNSYPILSTLFTVLVLREPLAAYKFGFIALLVFGGIVTSINWDEVRANGFQQQDIVKGFGWILLTTLAHALYFPLLGSFTTFGSWPTKLFFIKLFSAVLILAYFHYWKKQQLMPPKELIPFTSLLGFLEMVGWAGFSWATNNTRGQTAILIAALNSSALVTAVLAYVFLKEKLSKFQYLGIVIIVAALTGLAL